MMHRAKKSMGQNFLKSEGVLNNIIKAADPTPNDVILEIGPGLGALTEKLVPFAGKVIAVEKDDLLYEELNVKFSDSLKVGKLDLVHGDILKFNPETLRAYNDGDLAVYKLVANIPYNITGAIIEKFLSASFQPSTMILLVQKEVAERIIAKDKKTGNAGKESILSIAVKAYGTPSYRGTVKAGSFIPVPKVDSAIIEISGISRKNFQDKHHEQLFFQIVKAGFAHKRKTLAGNLKNIWEPEMVDEALRAVPLRGTARAEDVGITEWLQLSKIMYTVVYGI